MSDRPTLAAVVVNHDYAHFLPDALESLLAQTVPFDEIVAVDDGSTDESPAVLEKYADRVRVVHIPNGGQLGACRAGLAASTADYVYFLDADDLANPTLSASVRPRLVDRPAKVQFQLEGVDGDGISLDSVFPTFAAGYDAARMREDNAAIGFYVCPPTSGNVFARWALDALPLDLVDQRDFVDGPPALAMPYLGEVTSLPVPLARYRVHGGGHSQWSEPTPALLTKEIDWWRDRRAQTTALVAGAAPGARPPLYVLERRLMIAALSDDRHIGSHPVRLLRALGPTHLPARQKVLLGGWAVLLWLPLPRLRSRLVRARRSPVNRSPGFRRLVRFAVRGRVRASS